MICADGSDKLFVVGEEEGWRWGRCFLYRARFKGKRIDLREAGIHLTGSDPLNIATNLWSQSPLMVNVTVKNFSKQKEDLARQLADIAHKMELETKKREDIEKANIRMYFIYFFIWLFSYCHTAIS